MCIRSWADVEFTEHGDHRDTQQASAPAPSQVNLISPELTLILQLYDLLFIFY